MVHKNYLWFYVYKLQSKQRSTIIAVQDEFNSTKLLVHEALRSKTVSLEKMETFSMQSVLHKKSIKQ